MNMQPMPPMTPKQALDILTHASGLAPLTRQDHQNILRAVEILKQLLPEIPQKEVK